jgi:hypothetical protein
MNEEIQLKVEQLVELVRSKSPYYAVSFNLFVNGSEFNVGYDYRNAKSLKRDCISMRNLSGEFIEG